MIKRCLQRIAFLYIIKCVCVWRGEGVESIWESCVLHVTTFQIHLIVFSMIHVSAFSYDRNMSETVFIRILLPKVIMYWLIHVIFWKRTCMLHDFCVAVPVHIIKTYFHLSFCICSVSILFFVLFLLCVYSCIPYKNTL